MGETKLSRDRAIACLVTTIPLRRIQAFQEGRPHSTSSPHGDELADCETRGEWMFF
ncbi:hypothetical protein HPP92_016645 [Vanilla planifolia]|uniref:Uncharacterized protein n=1 Tax=Vanilla planifolia TaxID=51239 RepID=A0A835QGH6_VANPL|nr:hypothetical protein HPP92_017259 [Vanilla planifolia]KAG0472099.1 hypothetical protein HPP92_016645 [Vanilla planifolia]